MTYDTDFPTTQPHDTQTQLQSTPEPSRRRAHRARDFGIGYGDSSGYGRERRFAMFPDDALFRCR